MDTELEYGERPPEAPASPQRLLRGRLQPDRTHAVGSSSVG